MRVRSIRIMSSGLSCPVSFFCAERVSFSISFFNGAKFREGCQCFETVSRVSSRSGFVFDSSWIRKSRVSIDPLTRGLLQAIIGFKVNVNIQIRTTKHMNFFINIKVRGSGLQRFLTIRSEGEF